MVNKMKNYNEIMGNDQWISLEVWETSGTCGNTTYWQKTLEIPLEQ